MSDAAVSDAARHLQRVLASLADRLPEQVEGLLEGARFDDGRQALDRLRHPGHRSALGALDPAEVAWLADELQRRWARVGAVALDPIAWIEGPDEVRPGEPVTLVVRADGLEPAWTVAWSGAVPEVEGGASAVCPAPRSVTARVMGRGPEGRLVLTASWSPPSGQVRPLGDQSGGVAGGAESDPPP